MNQICTAKRHLIALVKISLGRVDVNRNEPDEDGKTPVSSAAFSEILRGPDDVNPGNLDEDGRKPSWWAPSNSHKERGENTTQTRRRQPRQSREN